MSLLSTRLISVSSISWCVLATRWHLMCSSPTRIMYSEREKWRVKTRAKNSFDVTQILIEENASYNPGKVCWCCRTHTHGQTDTQTVKHTEIKNQYPLRSDAFAVCFCCLLSARENSGRDGGEAKIWIIIQTSRWECNAFIGTLSTGCNTVCNSSTFMTNLKSIRRDLSDH